MIDWAWALDHLDDLVERTVQHFVLASISVVVGFVISLALAIWAARRPLVRAPIVSLSGILYTIPSVALFAALVYVTGLSLMTAVIPLILYTLLIYLRNMLAGLDGVPAEVLEAADAMGYGRWGRLVSVELPLALPLIVGGLRLASVSTIGLVTVSGILGDRFGGLGFFIFEGYRRSFPTEILFGAIPTIVLAIAIDVLLQAVQRRLSPWAPRAERARAVDHGRSGAEATA
ncbi:MAG TPA: ABC transporter permease [Candidatus Binatia bacterium]|nr:ABC transporter permease [Candidatus Binatia bacterium]